jgi:nucleobase:cation symporter-1, NCS1 family
MEFPMTVTSGTETPHRRILGVHILGVEQHHIDPIPASERHGRSRSLFFVWFAANLVIGTIITGALAVLVGNDLFWAVVSIVIGNLIGAVFMAFHSAQGPRLGVPQLIQSRGQFGFYGAILPVILGIILYVGFFAAGVIPAAQGLSTVFHGLSINSSILIIGFPSLFLAILGYDLIHRWQWAGTYVFLAGFVILTIALFAHGGLDWAPGKFAGGPFLLSVSIIAVFQISYAPYVSDYSRYLKEDIGISAPFWATFIGTNLSALWLMVVACMVTVIYPKLGTVAGINAVVGGAAGVIVLLTVAFGIIGVNAMNLYGGMLSLVTALSSGRSVAPSAILRAVLVAVIFAASILLSIVGAGNFMTNYENYLLLLLYLFIPWTAINLTDYYFVRKGSYDIEAFYDRHGVYGHDPVARVAGGVSLTAMIAYVIGFCVQLPFMNTTIYQGFMVRHLDGADISWIIGLIVSAALYYYLARGTVRVPTARPAPGAVIESGGD